ncbi:C-type lectin domain family 2 member B-like [Pleurodeles waltl]|uniref:C-type lectin domain family 2 member B-like n=1 Tax=Pleurodeles waltl TaxID=8319 RepID=UPI0037097919
MVIVMDDYLRYLEVEVVHSTSAHTVIPKFEKLMATHGLFGERSVQITGPLSTAMNEQISKRQRTPNIGASHRDGHKQMEKWRGTKQQSTHWQCISRVLMAVCILEMGILLYFLCAVLIKVFLSAAPYSVCPENWTCLRNKCYYFSNEKEKLSWPGSKTACSNKAGVLATSDDLNELGALISRTAGEQYFWVGHQDVDRGHWHWIDGREESLLQTRSSIGECAALKEKLLMSFPCHMLLRWTCKRTVTRVNALWGELSDV